MNPHIALLMTRPAHILLCGWRGDHHCYVDLIGVSPAWPLEGWRDAASALAIVQRAKHHKNVCQSPLRFPALRVFSFFFFSFGVQRKSSLTACADV